MASQTTTLFFTLEQICCHEPAPSGNRSVLLSNKTAVVLEPSQWLYTVARFKHLSEFQAYVIKMLITKRE